MLRFRLMVPLLWSFKCSDNLMFSVSFALQLFQLLSKQWANQFCHAWWMLPITSTLNTFYVSSFLILKSSIFSSSIVFNVSTLSMWGTRVLLVVWSMLSVWMTWLRVVLGPDLRLGIKELSVVIIAVQVILEWIKIILIKGLYWGAELSFVTVCLIKSKLWASNLTLVN